MLFSKVRDYLYSGQCPVSSSIKTSSSLCISFIIRPYACLSTAIPDETTWAHTIIFSPFVLYSFDDDTFSVCVSPSLARSGACDAWWMFLPRLTMFLTIGSYRCHCIATAHGTTFHDDDTLRVLYRLLARTRARDVWLYFLPRLNALSTDSQWTSYQRE